MFGKEADMAASTFSGAVRSFVRASKGWLGPEHAPAVTTLQVLAAALDSGEIAAPLVAQFGLTYRNLLREKPVASEGSTDPLAAALSAAQA